MNTASVSCPVDGTTVNVYQVRFTAALVCLLCGFFLLSAAWQIPGFMAIDFLARGFFSSRYSLLALLAGRLVKFSRTGVMPVSGAPKRFAARLGFVFSCTILSLCLLEQYTAAAATTWVMLLFAILESAIGFCAGCYVYHFFIKCFGRSRRPVTVSGKKK